MYKEDTTIKCVFPDTTKIWKYMDLWKFLSIIERKELYFTRIDKLQDNYEGTISEVSYWRNIALTKGFVLTYAQDCSIEETEKLIEREIGYCKEDFKYKNTLERKMYCVNCWHISDVESYAFWSIYSNKNEGIAIQSTIGRFKNSIKYDGGINIGEVEYIDYNQESSGNSMLQQFFKKRKEYAYEKEIRAVVSNKTSKTDPEVFINPKNVNYDPPDGIYISIDVTELIEKIFVSPNLEAWKRDLLDKLLIRFNFDIEICYSELSKNPFELADDN